jgi:uncharacterized membrane-anchored protein YitT (DUF2179 family)
MVRAAGGSPAGLERNRESENDVKLLERLSPLLVRIRGPVREAMLLTAGAVLLAVTIDMFLIPSDIAPGGVSGVAIILNQYTGWPVGITMLVLNLPLLLIGFRRLGRFGFLTRTVYVVLIYNLGVDLLAGWLPRGITQDLLLNSLYGGLLGGAATGLVYRASGTIGGTAILGRIIQKRTGVPVSQVYLLTDGGVILLAGLTFGWEKALYALITVFVWGVAADYVLEGPSVVRTAFVVTDAPDELAQALLSRLSIGVTAWAARGKFSEASHTVLFCTISRPEVDALRSVVKQVDPKAFVVISHGHQSTGGMLGPHS